MGSSWARKTAAASASGGGSFIEAHGKYLMAAREVLGKLGKEKGYKGESVTFKLEVVESEPNSLSRQQVQKDGKIEYVDVPPHSIGDVRNVTLNLDKTMGPGKLKAMLLAYMNMKEAALSEPVLDEHGKVALNTDPELTGDASDVGKPLVGELAAAYRIKSFVDNVTSSDQPLMGVLIRLDTYVFTIQSGPNQGKTGVGTNWYHVSQEDADIAARRETILSGKMVGKAA